jgi:hypothetical protein
MCQAMGGSRDRKIESFMEAAGLRDWVIGVEEIGSLPERLAELEAQKSGGDFGEQSRRCNRQAGRATPWMTQT